LSGSPFAEEKLFVPERGSVLHVLSKDGFMVWKDQGRLFAATSGFLLLSVKRLLGSRSYPRTKNLDAQRRNEEPMLLGGDGGPLTENGFS